ncbi:MAG: helix-turn-helix domain-containing protein [Firmicutes bacterium]|nr:helix-turn-helix domain-containing protein [Bacillota bacterium]
MTGNLIKNARKTKGMTQEELGNAIGMSGVAIMRYEKEQREPSKDTIEKIAEVLNVHPNDLVGWKIVNEFESFITYLKSLGYSVFVHQCSETSYSVEIQNNGVTAEFVQSEFEALQEKNKESLEGLILVQSQKNKKEPPSAITENGSDKLNNENTIE